MFRNTVKNILALGIGASLATSIALADDKTIKVGATPIPHAEILKAVQPLIEKKGYKLKIVEFTDYVLPNLALEDGDLDANFFQHVPYMNEFNKNKGTNIVKTVNVHLEPIGLYSNKVKSVKDLKKGATIAVPNDPANESRALNILEQTGVITFKSVELKTAIDIKDNPKKLKILEVDAPQLPRVLDDVDAAFINTNYALEAKLNPVKDAILLESKDSPYANVLSVRKGDENKPKTKVLNEVLNSETVKKFIKEKYKGAIVEAF